MNIHSQFALSIFALWAGTAELQARETPAKSDKPSRENIQQEMLKAHNAYRTDLGIKALEWSDTLAEHASRWSARLAKEGKMYHSPRSERNGEGENLWMGTADHFTWKHMVDGWGSEKKYYKHGKFPSVSTTGNWKAVGHYTQMIWKKTTRVGCALSKGKRNDVLVCRYSPPGNFQGEKAY